MMPRSLQDNRLLLGGLVVLQAVALWWVASATLPAVQQWHGDLQYYYDIGLKLRQEEFPYRDFELEYPPASLLAFIVPQLLAPGAPPSYDTFVWLFFITSLAYSSVIALALGAILTLQLFAAHDWPRLLAVLWFSIAVAFLFIRTRGAGPELEWWSNLREKFQPKPKFKVVPKATPRRVIEPEDVHVSIDPLLEKISKHGINSLTASERRALDRARNQLLNKSK